MRSLIALCLLATVGLARAGVDNLCNPDCANQPAQCCNVPQADTFAAFEADTHDTPGSQFRLLAPVTPGNQCVTDSTITSLAADIPQPGAQFETVQAEGLGGVIFAIKLVTEFATVSGADTGPCFKLQTQGLVHVPSPINVTTGCGTQMMSIGQPSYACILGPPIGKTLVCFKAKRVKTSLAAPLPPDTDRLEDICTLVDLL